ncbi:MAG: hypothetical protein FWE78_03255 [Methanimicrococcus sp.]|nr:hypothetical protein [Methanimicrococcus sp.]
MVFLKKDNVKIEGKEGTWREIGGRDISGWSLYLMENDAYGEEEPCIIIDENNNVILEDVWDGMDEINKRGLWKLIDIYYNKEWIMQKVKNVSFFIIMTILSFSVALVVIFSPMNLTGIAVAGIAGLYYGAASRQYEKLKFILSGGDALIQKTIKSILECVVWFAASAIIGLGGLIYALIYYLNTGLSSPTRLLVGVVLMIYCVYLLHRLLVNLKIFKSAEGV